MTTQQKVEIAKDRAIDEVWSIVTDQQNGYRDLTDELKARIQAIGSLLCYPDDAIGTVEYAGRLGFLTGDKDENRVPPMIPDPQPRTEPEFCRGCITVCCRLP